MKWSGKQAAGSESRRERRSSDRRYRIGMPVMYRCLLLAALLAPFDVQRGGAYTVLVRTLVADIRRPP
jgi:hypothetical protein